MRPLIFASIVFAVGLILFNSIATQSVELIQVAGKSAIKVDERQLKLALELYYARHGEYPIIKNSQQLLAVLKSEELIENVNRNFPVFTYMNNEQGQQYELFFK